MSHHNDNKSDSCSDDPVIYMETVSAPTNIACIKYWGKSNVELNTPINSSLSITLDQTDLRAVTTVAASTSFTRNRLWLNGKEVEDINSNPRFRSCLDEMKRLANNRIDARTNRIVVTRGQWSDMHVHVSSYNTFPTAAGLASSAAGYAALVAALAKLYDARETFPGQFTTIARRGSGSACRSLHGGFVAWRMGGTTDDGSDSVAEQIADESYWPDIRAVIMVVSDVQKSTSSTTGMGTSVATSQLLAYRASHVVPRRMADMEAAFLQRDFETFARLTMADSNQFHAACLDTYPPIFYLTDVSRSIIQLVHVYNDWAGAHGNSIRAAYTFDAGPNAVLYTLEKYAVELCALMLKYYPPPQDTTGGEGIEGYINNPDIASKAATYELDSSLIEAVEKKMSHWVPKPGDVKMMYYTKSGPGPQSLSVEEAVIDPKTGLNTYQP